MISKLLVCGLLALTTLPNVNCTDDKTSEIPPQHDTTTTPPTTPEPPIIQPITKLDELRRELVSVQTEIRMEENTYYGLLGDASRAMSGAIDSTKSTEEQELYKERSDISYNAAKESEKKLNELKNKKDSIQTEINIASSQ